MESLFMLALIWVGGSDPTNNAVYFFYRDEAPCVAEETRRNKASSAADPRAKWVCMSYLCMDGAEVKAVQPANKEWGTPLTAACRDRSNDRRYRRDEK